MSTWSVFDDDGLFIGMTISGSADFVQLNTPPGCHVVLGEHDRSRFRVRWTCDDFGTLQPGVVLYRPPPPDDTDLVAWAWDESAWMWRPMPTAAAVAIDMGAERDRRLSATDWVVARAIERGEPVPRAWVIYREALRNLSDQPGWPTSVEWPSSP